MERQLLKMFLLFVIATVFLGKIACLSVDDEPIITLTAGQIQGYADESTNGNVYYGFSGIPYVDTPKRFQPAEPPSSWSGVLNATMESDGCPQFSLFYGIFQGSENCLTANVYVSKLKSRNPRKKLLPVIVSIHGGGFTVGSGGKRIYGPQNLMDYPIILVTFNYRLGIFGFLNTEDENAYGNYGMLDQVMLLNWVQENIVRFGGDPNMVTIYGESSGSASVMYHLLSPLSSGLFHRAILSSGSPLNPWAFIKHPLQVARECATVLQCPQNDTKQMVECFSNQTVSAIIQAANSRLGDSPGYFAPSVEAAGGPGFLTEDPSTLMNEGKIVNKVPVIIGFNENEGYNLYLIFGSIFKNTGKAFFQKDFPIFLDKFCNVPANMTEVISLITKEYVDNAEDLDKDETFLKVISEISGDATIAAEVSQTAELLSQVGVPTYAYKFSYSGQHCLSEMVGGQCGQYASHGDDLFYIFRVANIKMTNVNDINMTQTMDDLWTSFASDRSGDVSWPRYDQKDRLYLNLTLPPTVESGYLSDKMQFWTKTVPQLVHKCETDGCTTA